MSHKVILRSLDWIVAGGPGLVFRCLRCRKTLDLSNQLPLPVAALPFHTRGFQESHRRCLPGPEATHE